MARTRANWLILKQILQRWEAQGFSSLAYRFSSRTFFEQSPKSCKVFVVRVLFVFEGSDDYPWLAIPQPCFLQFVTFYFSFPFSPLEFSKNFLLPLAEGRVENVSGYTPIPYAL